MFAALFIGDIHVLKNHKFNHKGESMLTDAKRNQIIAIIKWLVVFGVPIVFWQVPMGLSPEMQKFFAITIWGVLAWATVIIPVEATGIALPALYLFSGITTAAVAFSPWANTVIWSTATCVLIGVAADKSGVAKRMAYSILLKVGCSLKKLVWGFSIAGLIMAFIITDSFARAVIFITIAVGLCKALNIPFKSPEATALGLAAFFGMSGPSIMTLTGGTGLQILSVYRDVVVGLDPAYQMNYAVWLLHNFIPSIAWTLLGVFCILKGIKFDNSRYLGAREELLARQEELGKINTREVCVLVALVLLVIDYIFAGNFGLDPLLMPALAIPLFFIPKFGILTIDDFQASNFKILFMMTGALSIGSVGASIGVVALLSATIAPLIGGSPIAMTFGTFVVCVIANFFLTPLAIVFSLGEALAQMAVSFGFNPLPVMYALNIGADTYIFPYEFAILLLCFSFGIMEYKTTIKVLGLRFVGAFAMMAFVCIPVWYVFGLL